MVAARAIRRFGLPGVGWRRRRRTSLAQGVKGRRLVQFKQATRFFGAAAACCCVAAGPAAAATPLGQLPPGAGELCGGGTVFLQDTIVADPVYAVPAGGGVITAWATKAGAGAGQSGALKVLSRDGGTDFTVVGTSALEPLTAGQTNTFPTRIVVAGGETLGYYFPAG